MLLNIGSVFILYKCGGGLKILQGKQGETKEGRRTEGEKSWKEGRRKTVLK